MTWVKLDDGFALHRKAARIGSDGVTLFVALLCYCARNLTDGHVPEGDLVVAWPWPGLKVEKVVSTLISAGLVEKTEGGYQVHDYLDWQPSRSEILAKREAEKLKKQRQRGVIPPGGPPERPPGTRKPSPGDTPGTPGSRARARSESRPSPSPVPIKIWCRSPRSIRWCRRRG